MRLMKLFVAIASVAAVAIIAAPLAQAQCSPALQFSSSNPTGMDSERIRWDATGTTSQTGGDGNVGSAIGLFWRSDDSGEGNNFGGNCPSQTFWRQAASGGNKAPNRYLDAFIGSGNCQSNTCPDPVGAAPPLNLTVAVEDVSQDGQDARFAVVQVDPTPGQAGGVWNYRRVRSGSPVLPFQSIPTVDVTGSNRLVAPDPNEGDVNAQVSLPDAGAGAEFAGNTNGGAGSPIQATDLISSVDIYMAVGSDPGRDRTNPGWMFLQSVPYSGSSASISDFLVNCMDQTTQDVFLAAGLTYNGGTGGGVQGPYLGRATSFECDPNLAQPDQPRNIRPSRQDTQPDSLTPRRGQRGGGRR